MSNKQTSEQKTSLDKQKRIKQLLDEMDRCEQALAILYSAYDKTPEEAYACILKAREIGYSKQD